MDGQGHLLPEAKVVYIYLSLSLCVSCLPLLSLWRVLLIHFPCSQVPQQICDFKQVTFYEQVSLSNIYTKTVPISHISENTFIVFEVVGFLLKKVLTYVS